MCVCWFDVFILLFEYTYLLSYRITWAIEQWSSVYEKKKRKVHQDCGVLLLQIPPQSSSTHLSIKDRLTDLWPLISLRDFNWLTGSMWTAHSPSVSHLKHTRANTSSTCVWCVCVCDSVIDPWRIFWLFFFFFALLCTAWTIQVIVMKSSRKDFTKITIILLSFLSSKCKECFSLPAIKATMTLFLYTNGAKNISIYLYI